MRNSNYLMALKMAHIEPEDGGEKICSLLSDDVLKRLTKQRYDLIKPIIDEAENMLGGICDENINKLLNDSNLIASMLNVIS